MKLGKQELQFLLDFAKNAKGSDIKYFVFDNNNELCGIVDNAPQNIKDIYDKYQKQLERR